MLTTLPKKTLWISNSSVDFDKNERIFFRYIPRSSPPLKVVVPGPGVVVAVGEAEEGTLEAAVTHDVDPENRGEDEDSDGAGDDDQHDGCGGESRGVIALRGLRLDVLICARKRNPLSHRPTMLTVKKVGKVQHQRWISGNVQYIHLCSANKAESNLALKPR